MTTAMYARRSRAPRTHSRWWPLGAMLTCAACSAKQHNLEATATRDATRIPRADRVLAAPRAWQGASAIALIEDTNGDGLDDLVVGVPMERSAYLFHAPLPRRLDPKLATARFSLPLPSTDGEMMIGDAGDLNHDGLADIFVAYQHPAHDTRVWAFSGLQQGDTSTEEALWSIRDLTHQRLGARSTLAIGDLDGDDHPDLVAHTPDGATVFLGSSAVTTGRLEPRWTITVDHYAVWDADDDEIDEIVSVDDDVVVWNAPFREGQILTPQAAHHTSVDHGDLTGDGFDDLVVFETSRDGSLTVQTRPSPANVDGRPVSHVQQAKMPPHGGDLVGHILTDLDGDGDDEVAILVASASEGPQQIAVFYGGQEALETRQPDVFWTTRGNQRVLTMTAGRLNLDDYGDLLLVTTHRTVFGQERWRANIWWGEDSASPR